MNDDESKFETVIRNIYHSPKIRKTLSIATFSGIVICAAVLFPPVQKIILAFAGTVVDLRSHNMEFLQNRLFSLLSLAVLGIAVLILLLCCLHSKRIAEFLSNKKNDRIISVLGLGIAFFGLAFVTIFSYRHGRQWLDSDHAAEMDLGKLLADENTLVSRQWCYSTELRLVYQTVFSMPLFKLFGSLDNWAFIRSATIFLNNTLLIASYIFMMRQMRIRNKWIYPGAIFLLAPLSITYWGIVTFGGYYVFFIVQNFCCLGLLFRLVSPPSPANRMSSCRDFILFSALSLVLGVQGIRSLFGIQIPLMLACLVAGRFNGIPKKKTLACLGIYSFILCCIGFIVHYLLRFIYTFYSFDNMRIDNLYEIFFAKLGQNVVSLFSFFGFVSGERILSAQGITSMLAIIFTLYLLGYMPAFLMRNRIREDNRHENNQNKDNIDPRKFMILYFFVSLIFNIFVFQTVGEKVTLRYFIPFLILYVPLLAVLFERTEKNGTALSKTGLVAAVFLFIFTRSVLNFQELNGYDENSFRTGYIKYLSDHNLEFGFSGFLNANVTTELTNGKIRIAGLEPDGLKQGSQFKIQGWLNPKAFYERSYYDGESFLLLTRDEWEAARQTGRSFVKKTPDYDDGKFIIFRYPSAAIIHDTILDK
jgi:hypothetical protein